VIKFVVLLYKKPGMSTDAFITHLKNIHGPLALRLPRLRRYRQNLVVEDGKRQRPPWDALVELFFDNRADFEAAWETPEGKASDADLPLFLDLDRTSWSVVEEMNLM